MQSLFQDIRHASRMLVKKPGSSGAIILMLALGIGATTAMFSAIDAVLMRPLPYPEPDRLVRLWQRAAHIGYPQFWLSEAEVINYRERQSSFESFAVYRVVTANLTGAEEATRVSVATVSRGFFEIPAAGAMLGRTFLPEEHIAANREVAVLAYATWQGYFGGDPEIIGKSVDLDGRNYTVVGVMPQDFGFPFRWLDVWVPLGLDGAELDLRQRHNLFAIARLRSGITVEQASANVNTIAQQLRQEYAQSYDDIADFGAYVVPLREDTVARVRPALLMLMGGTGLVLLIACINAANMFMARTCGRERELAVRQALGANWRRITGQLLRENMLLFLLGGGAGMLLAQYGTGILISLSPGDMPGLDAAAIDGRALAFALGISLLTGFLFSLVPALPFARADLRESLRAGGRTSAGAHLKRLQRLFVVAEVGLSVVLLSTVGLLARSLVHALNVELGYQIENVVTFNVSLPTAAYPEDSDVVAFQHELLTRIDALPGVLAVGMTPALPLSGTQASTTVLIEELPPSTPMSDYPFGGVTADLRTVSAGYFRALSMELVSGRFLNDTDCQGTPLVAVVDETFASRAWPGCNPIGKRIALPMGPDEELSWHGVIGAVRHAMHYGPDIGGREQIYVPISQLAPRRLSGSAYVAVKCAVKPMETLGTIRTLLTDIDPHLPIYDVATMDQRLDFSMGQRRFYLLLLSVFGGASLVLVTIGIYAVIAYSAGQRTREMAVRMALGAQRNHVLALVLREGLALSVAGVGIGLAASLAWTHMLSSLLYEVSPNDPVTFIAVAGLLTCIALLACYLPARRATKVDPMVALRCE